MMVLRAWLAAICVSRYCEHDDESIYQAAMKAYHNTELRQKYGVVGRSRVTDFSIQRTLQAIYLL